MPLCNRGSSVPDNDLQKLSPAYRLPASDADFILSDSMQGVRFLLEFAKADERLRQWGAARASARQTATAQARWERRAWRTGTTRRAASVASCPNVAARSLPSTASATT